jgi:ribonuclease HI
LSYQKKHSVTIYTDGSSRGNPGPGGYGTILISGTYRKELSEGYVITTNNRMELLAVIAGLEALKQDNTEVTVYSDSKYVVDSVEKGWVFEWEKIRFKKKKNSDLWIRFLKSYRKHDVKFVWVKGHAENKENNLCDQIAVQASYKEVLKHDPGFVPDTESVL